MRYVKRTRVLDSPDEVFSWHMRQGAFERLSPPWQDVQVLSSRGRPDEEGYQVELSVGLLGPLRRRWVAEHLDIRVGREFRDVQRSGPFARWEHTHRFLPAGEHETFLEDAIDFELPFGGLGRLGGGWVERSLERLFRYRHRTTADDLRVHRRYREGSSPLRILVTGSSGLIGSVLVPFLSTGGHEVFRLSRSPREGALRWIPEQGVIPIEELEGFDAVVHLAGEGIASGRWTSARKRRIRESRIEVTRRLAESLAGVRRKPRVLLSASAIGYYGDRGVETLDESSGAGDGFLSSLCQEWEGATEPAARAGIRVVHMRFGIVLSPAGGALQKMLAPFRWGVGGVVGTGKQFMSWITIDDVASAILHLLANDRLEGAVNVVSPDARSNRELTRALGRALHRPAVVPLPALGARLALGEMADELLLASTRVVPRKLVESGLEFRDPGLDEALARLLGAGSGA